MRRIPRSLPCILAMTIAASTAAHARRFEVFDLGRNVDPHQVSDSRVVAGTDVRKSRVSGARWVDGRWHRLDGPGDALAVNFRGDIAGYSNLGIYSHWPTIWPAQGDARLLQLPGMDANLGEARAIADDGSSAGWARGDFGVPRCFHAGPDGVGTEMTLYGQCYVNAMNSHGQVIGYGDFSENELAAFLWQEGEFRNLGKLHGTRYCEALGINELGEIVGACDASGFDTRAFFWKDGVMKALKASKDYLWTAARSINDRGDIVGFGSTDGRSNRALRFVAGGQAIDLNTETIDLADWSLVDARSVNDEGVIVGIGYRSDGIFHTFALVPKE